MDSVFGHLFVVFLSLVACSVSFALQKGEVVPWLRAKADTFGCFLEGRFGYRDPKFNCKLQNYVNRSTACEGSEQFGEGPAFPQAHVQDVNPIIRKIDLAWERGELQAISLELNAKYSNAQVEKLLHLPSTGHYPKNLSRIAMTTCLNNATCLILEGFPSQLEMEGACKIPTSK